MIEAVPQKLHAPNKEPLLRIGIVLAEDEKKELLFSVPDASYSVSADDKQHPLPPDTEFSASVRDGRIQISSVVDGVVIDAPPPLRISAARPLPLAPRSGAVVNGIVAGRSFHWRKELTQTLPGNLELHLEDGNLVLVNELEFESYVACVVSSEMSARCPAEFAKAQAVAARSWAFVFLNNKHEGKPFTICNDDDCQRYQGTTHCSAETLQAVLMCRGKFLLTPEKHVCPAYYSKSCGGHTEDPAEIFGFHLPGFTCGIDADAKSPQRVFCSPAVVPEGELKTYLGAVDEKGHYFRWTHSLTHDELVRNLEEKFQLKGVAEVRGLSPERRSKGKRITRLRIRYASSSGEEQDFVLQDQYDIRRALHPSFLFSSAFEMKITREKGGRIGTIEMSGAGWGHGVGLCQIGALGMAMSGRPYAEILKHYFQGCDLVSAY